MDGQTHDDGMYCA